MSNGIRKIIKHDLNFVKKLSNVKVFLKKVDFFNYI